MFFFVTTTGASLANNNSINALEDCDARQQAQPEICVNTRVQRKQRAGERVAAGKCATEPRKSQKEG